MATTLDDLKRFLDDSELNYNAFDEDDTLAIGFGCESDETTYRDSDGDPHIQLVVRLAENGEFVSVFSPRAWNLRDCDNRQAVCEALLRIQCQTKLIRFDLDGEGYLQPNIEIPLERSSMCAEQLQRAISCVLLVIRRFDPVLKHALETGIVDLGLAYDKGIDGSSDGISHILELGEAAGGIQNLERLLGGDELSASE